MYKQTLVMLNSFITDIYLDQDKVQPVFFVGLPPDEEIPDNLTQ